MSSAKCVCGHEETLQKLIAFAMTCRANNTGKWMILFEKRINAAIQSLGESDRVVYDGEKFRHHMNIEPNPFAPEPNHE